MQRQVLVKRFRKRTQLGGHRTGMQARSTSGATRTRPHPRASSVRVGAISSFEFRSPDYSAWCCTNRAILVFATVLHGLHDPAWQGCSCTGWQLSHAGRLIQRHPGRTFGPVSYLLNCLAACQSPGPTALERPADSGLQRTRLSASNLICDAPKHSEQRLTLVIAVDAVRGQLLGRWQQQPPRNAGTLHSDRDEPGACSIDAHAGNQPWCLALSKP